MGVGFSFLSRRSRSHIGGCLCFADSICREGNATCFAAVLGKMRGLAFHFLLPLRGKRVWVQRESPSPSLQMLSARPPPRCYLFRRDYNAHPRDHLHLDVGGTCEDISWGMGQVISP